MARCITTSQQKAELLFFATLKERTGTERASIEIPAQTTVAQFKILLREKFPNLPEGDSSLLVAVNKEYAFDHEVIPAGAESHAESREYVFEEDVELLRFMPHMHLRGKAALYEVTYPDGRHETLLHVPNYAFNWQHSYRFADPPFIPAGSVLRFTLWWDNSENNPANPDPSAEVRWNAACSLALFLHDRSGLRVLRQMLDRKHVEKDAGKRRQPARRFEGQ